MKFSCRQQTMIINAVAKLSKYWERDITRGMKLGEKGFEFTRGVLFGLKEARRALHELFKEAK